MQLINDLEATAFGLGELSPEQLYTLNEGEADPLGHRALIAAGLLSVLLFPALAMVLSTPQERELEAVAVPLERELEAD